jgi:hypothetical protein
MLAQARGKAGTLVAIALFDVFEPRVQHFFDAMELAAPEVAHFVEAATDDIETRIHVPAKIAQSRIIDQDAH